MLAKYSNIYIIPLHKFKNTHPIHFPIILNREREMQ